MRKKILLISKRILPVIVILLVLNSFIFEIFFPKVNNYEISFDNLPEEFDGFKILVLADIHYRRIYTTRWLESFVKKVNSIDKDAVVMVGDYIEYILWDHEVKKIWSYFDQIKAPHGVYMVMGNHEYYGNDVLNLRILAQNGLSVRYDHSSIKKGEDTIAIGGGGDYYFEDPGFDKAFKNVPDDVFKIMLTHNPDTTMLDHTQKIDLFICGHTHGGQVVIPFINYSPLVPVKHKAFTFGLKETSRNEKVFISKGIGWTRFPIRFNCRSEYAVITLRKGGNKE